MASQQPFMPEDYTPQQRPLQVYDTRTQQFLPAHEQRLRTLTDEFGLDIFSLAYKPATDQPLDIDVHNDMHINIGVDDQTYKSLHEHGAVLKHAFVKVLNTKQDSYGVLGAEPTNHEYLDGIIDAYKTFRDSLRHRALFGWVSHEAYANGITRRHIHTLEHQLEHEPTQQRLQALRSAYLTTYLMRKQPRRTHSGIAQNAQLLFDVFRTISHKEKREGITRTEKLNFFGYLATLEANAVSLQRSYQRGNLQPPQQPKTNDTTPVPERLKDISMDFEKQLLEYLSNYRAN